jgi:hypothetical protein
MALGSTQRLTETSRRNIPGGIGPSVLVTDPEARVRFPALPEKSTGLGTGSTQPREYN